MNIIFLLLVITMVGRHGYEAGRASKSKKRAKNVQKDAKTCKKLQNRAESCILIERIHEGNRR